MAKNNKNWLDKYSPNKNSSKKPKRYPAGGFLDYQNSYQGFGNGPQLYQDNSYFRTIIPGSSEDINSLINKPTFMSDINTGIGYANKALDIVGSLQSQFPKKQGGEGFTGKIDPNQGGGPEIMDNSLKSFQGLGEEIKLNNLGSHFNFEQKIPNFAGGGLAEMYGNSYGNMSNVNSPIKFNSSTGRAKAGDFMDTVGNDWLHTKMNDNRLRKEDDKIDWGVANFLKEPVSFGAGLIAASPIGTMTGLDKIYNDSFMSRTVGGKLGGGTMKTTMGAGQVVGGVLSGNAGMVTAGVGDLGEGIVGTAGSISADANIGGSYDKNAYLSNKKIEKGATEFNQAAHSLSSFMGGIDGFSGGASGVFGTKGGDLSSIGKGMGPKMQNFGKVSEQLYNNNFFGRPQGTNPVGTFPGGGYVNYSIIDRIMHDLESSKKKDSLVDKYPNGGDIVENFKYSRIKQNDGFEYNGEPIQNHVYPNFKPSTDADIYLKHALDIAGMGFYPASLAGAAIDAYNGDYNGAIAGVVPFGKGFKYIKAISKLGQGTKATQKAQRAAGILGSSHLGSQIKDGYEDIIKPFTKYKK